MLILLSSDEGIRLRVEGSEFLSRSCVISNSFSLCMLSNCVASSISGESISFSDSQFGYLVMHGSEFASSQHC